MEGRWTGVNDEMMQFLTCGVFICRTKFERCYVMLNFFRPAAVHSRGILRVHVYRVCWFIYLYVADIWHGRVRVTMNLTNKSEIFDIVRITVRMHNRSSEGLGSIDQTSCAAEVFGPCIIGPPPRAGYHQVFIYTSLKNTS